MRNKKGEPFKIFQTVLIYRFSELNLEYQYIKTLELKAQRIFKKHLNELCKSHVK